MEAILKNQDLAIKILQELDDEFYQRLPNFSKNADFGFTPQAIHEVIIKKITDLVEHKES